MKNLLKKFLNLSILGIILLNMLNLEKVFAYNFNPSSDIFNIKVDQTQKKLKFSMIVYVESSATDDNNLWRALVNINGVRYLEIYCKSIYPTEVANADSRISLYNQDEDTWGFISVQHTDINANSRIVGNYAYVDFEIELAEADLYNSQYTLTFPNINFEDANGNTSLINVQKAAVNGWPAVSLSNFQATNNFCTQVNLSWALSTGTSNDIFYEISENGQSFTKSQFITSYSRILDNPEPVDYNYTIMAGYGAGLKNSVTYQAVGGPPRTGYTNVSSFTATDHTCDKILLNWNESTSGTETTKYLISWDGGEAKTVNKGTNTLSYLSDIESKNYNFTINSINKCGFSSPGVNVISNLINLTAPNDLRATILPSGEIKLDWTAAIGQKKYFIKKSFGGTVVTIDNIDKNATSYTDANVKSCITYKYEIFTSNECNTSGLYGSFIDIKIDPVLSNTFVNGSLKVSKGYYPSKVLLQWTPANNSTLIEAYEIFRKLYGSTSDSVLINTSAASARVYVDNEAEAGVLYEYFIQGKTSCEGIVLYSNQTSDIGFRSPIGTVSGHVEFEGGIAVKDAKIYVSRVSGIAGNSASFDGIDDYIDVADANVLDVSTALTIESWINLSSVKSNNYVISKGTAYELYIDNKRPVLAINGTKLTLGTDIIEQSQWQHLAATYNGSMMKLFLNGKCIDSLAYAGSVLTNATNLYIGKSSASDYFSGKLDELRVSNIAKTDQQIAADYDRILSGEENGTIASWTFDEGGTCPFIFDKAKSGTIYLENTGTLMNGAIFSSSIPTGQQLGYAGITDKNGDYIIQGIRYNGSGENYKLTPAFGVHQFSPSSRTLFIGEGSAIQNGQDFKDISAFDVSGNVKFAGTTCPVKDIILQIDGSPVIKNGQLIMTDADGNFKIKVPIGEHQISVMRNGHEFSQGIFPPKGYWNFQETVTGIQFVDTTLITVVGRVVGGLEQKAKSPVLGSCTNNIGKATLFFNTQNGCFTKSISTADSSGQYLIKLPPMKYTIPDFNIASNPVIQFKNNSILDLSISLPLQKAVDTTFIKGTRIVKNIDSVAFHSKLDFVYRSVPKMDVTNASGTSPFIGDSTFTYISKNKLDTTILKLNPNPFPFPIFNQNVRYQARINAFEIYTNADKGILQTVFDTVPVTEGKITINNELAYENSTIIQMKGGDTLYTFVAGNPNPLKDSNPLYDYTKVFKLQLTTGSTTIDWEPLSTEKGKDYRAYILGAKSSDGQSFVSFGPEVVDFVLRDPPGSNSFSKIDVGTKKTFVESFTLGGAYSNTGKAEIKAGMKSMIGLGFIVESQITTNTQTNWKIEAKMSEQGEFTQTTTFNEAKQTNSNPELVGAMSDLFIGKAKNMEFGFADGIQLTAEEVYTLNGVDESSNIVNINGVNYSIARQSTLMLVPGGYETGFVYTRDHILNYLIPNLVKLRNQLFVNQPLAYQSKLDKNDDKYGTNNDDPIWGNDVSTNSPKSTQDKDYNGLSYTFTMLEVDAKDSVRVFNQQIRLWREALKNDEEEKAKAIASGNVDRNISINAGPTFTYSTESSKLNKTLTEIEYNISHETKIKMTGIVNEVGAESEQGISIGIETKGSFEYGKEETTTYSYEINDPDIGDYFSIDVYKSKNDNGPMFYTRAGQSKCPHESGFKSMFYKPGTVLSASTFKREVPTILANNASSAKLTNIPADNAATFNLTLGNESESGEDMVYMLRVLENSNPNGAIVKMDGIPVYREISVPAGSSVNKTLTIEKGPGDVYDYDSIAILIHSPCQFSFDLFTDIVDTAYVSAYFIPTCTKINIIDPNDKWVVNNSNKDTLNAIISNYDINFAGLNNFKFWYRPSNETSWVGLETWHKDTTGLKDPTAKLISTSNDFTLYPWNLDEIKDGYFDIKTSSSCTFADLESPVLKGIIDRVNPHPFGNPQPADGILSPNDEIQINFNETIDAGLVNTYNFDIRGVLNQSNLGHDASLNFDGVNDYLMIENGINLKNSFSVELWVKRDKLAVSETFFAQGNSAAQSVSIGFNPTNKVVFNFAGINNTSQSVIADDKWHHVVCTFDETDGASEIFIDGKKDVTKTMVADYTQDGRIYVGKSSFDAQTFSGNLHELRIWNKAIGLDEAIERMNISLSGNEFNLIGCWKMDEVRGAITKDIARSRNAQIIGAAWSVLPLGSSNAFDGIDDYLEIPASTVGVTKEMDFTVEFWLNAGIQSDTVTLVSNGKGTDVVNNPTGWSIVASPDGKLHVLNNGHAFDVNVNVLDTSWHHFALVVNRIGNTYAYLDGNLAATSSSEFWDGFGGSSLWIGSRGWFSGTVQYHDKYFNGMIDELRVWDLARKQEQIDRDLVNRLKGDESGLRIYLPFEKYNDVMGVLKLQPSLTNIADSLLATNYNGADYSTNVPMVKLERPVSSIPFTYSINNDKIIVTPNVDAALIENVTLDITCQKVKDMNGNTMKSGKTWIAYIDKNQVKWQDQELDFDKLLNNTLTFEANIINSGGALKTYAIKNLPNWLTVDNANGIISPNTYKTLKFTVDPSINIGKYEQSVSLLTDFGYNEPLLVRLNVSATPPAWKVDATKYQYSENVIGQVIIDGIISNDANDMVAAFVGNECRGVANLKYLPDYDKYLAFIDIYSNTESGEKIDFRIWNASEGIIHSDVLPNLTFIAYDILGTIATPVDIQAVNTFMQEIQLAQGWKWISFNLSSPKMANLNNFLSGITKVNGDMVKGLTAFDQYDSKLGWLGSITSGGGFKNNQMYMMKMANLNKLSFTGSKMKSSENPITINNGWNWISFIPNKNIKVNDAFGNYNPVNGDIVKSQFAFAMYDKNMGWLGSLEYMVPGMGYMFKTANSGTTSLIYPEAGLMKFAGELKNGSKEFNIVGWNFVPESHQFNSSIIAETDLEALPGFDKNYVLGAFVGSECRGIVEPQFNSDLNKWFYFATVYGNLENEQVNFKIINTLKNETFEMNEIVLFRTNEIVGTFANPLVLTTKTLAPEGDNLILGNNFISAFPNPFSSNLLITYQIAETQNVTISVYNQLGKLVATILNSEVSKGTHTIYLDEKAHVELIPGVYFIKLESAIYSETLKVVKIK